MVLKMYIAGNEPVVKLEGVKKFLLFPPVERRKAEGLRQKEEKRREGGRCRGVAAFWLVLGPAFMAALGMQPGLEKSAAVHENPLPLPPQSNITAGLTIFINKKSG